MCSFMLNLDYLNLCYWDTEQIWPGYHLPTLIGSDRKGDDLFYFLTRNLLRHLLALWLKTIQKPSHVILETVKYSPPWMGV